MLRITFVLAPDNLNYKPFKNQQLTAMYLLTILEKTFGDRVNLSITDLRGVKEDAIKYYIDEKDVYCYTVYSPLYRDICELKNLIRSLYPKARHLVGGPHVDLFWKEIKGFDALAVGEGEIIIVQIIKDILKNKLKRVYKNSQVVDINKYPYSCRKYQPSACVVDTDFFVADTKQPLRATNVLFSRGCPFRCRFCANLNYGPIRYRLPKLVEEEIKYLKRAYGVEALVLRDDNAIPVNKKIAEPFLKAIGRAKVKWRGQSRANGITEDMVKLAAKTGCLDIAMGIESPVPKVLEITDKKIDLDEAKKYIKTLKKYGINVKLLLMLGLPGEPNDIVSRMLDFIDETQPRSVGLALFCPFPGSEITNNYKKYGIKYINPNLHEYRILYGRFDKDEKPRLMFEYNKVTPWGKGMSSAQIIDNYTKLQAILRKRNLNF